LFPLTTQGKQVGIAFFVPSQRDCDPDEYDVQRLTILTDVLANVLAREQSERDLQVSRGNARQLARKLLTAQEDERRRLAREMHDDITQRLAAAAIACGQIQKDADLSQEAKMEVSELSESLIKISKDVHQFSRRLHPSILEELGLLDAIRHESNAVRLQSHIVVTIRFSQIPNNLPKELQLCLYRIAQEGLRNMVKHSRATEGEITLNADAEWVHLQVKDNGQGISVVRDREEPGLGLVAMEERVHLVGGLLTITSGKDAGTCIDVRLPWKPDEMESFQLS
jgi:signal transduction histidine kinase